MEAIRTTSRAEVEGIGIEMRPPSLGTSRIVVVVGSKHRAGARGEGLEAGRRKEDDAKGWQKSTAKKTPKSTVIRGKKKRESVNAERDEKNEIEIETALLIEIIAISRRSRPRPVRPLTRRAGHRR